MATQEELQETAEVLEGTISVDRRRASTELRYTTDDLAAATGCPVDEVDEAMGAMAEHHSKVSSDGDEWVVSTS